VFFLFEQTKLRILKYAALLPLPLPPQVQASAMLLLLTMKVKGMELDRFLKIGRFIPKFKSTHTHRT
jgi:hypothetical protein